MTATPPLGPRLLAVARAVLNGARGGVHADIGSDHALLPRYLLETNRDLRVIAVEKHPGPLQRSRQALAPFIAAGRAEVRSGDGFAPLGPGEADSASVCGLGAARIAALLAAQPERLPDRLTLQSVDSPAPLRRWALAAGFHLLAEASVPQSRFCAVLSFARRSGPDPAYAAWSGPALPLEFGPWLLLERDPALASELQRERRWLRRALARREVTAFREKLARVEAALVGWTEQQ